MTGLVSEELLSAYFDDEVTLEERAVVERWLAESPAARSMLGEFSLIRQQLQQLPVPSISRNLTPTGLVQTNLAASVPVVPVPAGIVRDKAKHGNWKREWLAAGIGSLVTALTLVLAVGSPFESHSVYVATGQSRPEGALTEDMAARSMRGAETFEFKDQRSLSEQESILARLESAPRGSVRGMSEAPEQVLLREKQATPNVPLGLVPAADSDLFNPKTGERKVLSPSDRVPAETTALTVDHLGMGGGLGNLDSRSPAAAESFHRHTPSLHPAEDQLPLSDEPLLRNTISREPLEFPGAAPSISNTVVNGVTDGVNSVADDMSDDTRALRSRSEKTLEQRSLQLQVAAQAGLRFKKSAPFEVGAVVRYLSPDDPQVGVVEFQVLDMEEAAGQIQVLLSRNDIALAPVQVWELVNPADVSHTEVGLTHFGNGTHIDSFAVNAAPPAAASKGTLAFGGLGVANETTAEQQAPVSGTLVAGGYGTSHSPTDSADLFVAYVDAEPERLAQLLDEFSNHDVVVSTRLDRPLDLRVVNSVVFDELPAEETTDPQPAITSPQRRSDSDNDATTLLELPVAGSQESLVPDTELYLAESPGTASQGGESAEHRLTESGPPEREQNPQYWMDSNFAWQARQVVNFYHVTAPQQSLPASDRKSQLSEVELLMALSELPVSALSPANQEVPLASAALDTMRQQALLDSPLQDSRSVPLEQVVSHGDAAALSDRPQVQSAPAGAVEVMAQPPAVGEDLNASVGSVSLAWGAPLQQEAVPLQRAQPHNTAVANWLYRLPAVDDPLAGLNGRSYQRGVTVKLAGNGLFSEALDSQVGPMSTIPEGLSRHAGSVRDLPAQPASPAAPSAGLPRSSVTQSINPASGVATWGEVGSRYVMQSRSSQSWQNPLAGSHLSPMPPLAELARSAEADDNPAYQPGPQGPAATHWEGTENSPETYSITPLSPDSMGRTLHRRGMLPDTQAAAIENEAATIVNGPAAPPVLAAPAAATAPRGGVRILVVLQRATLP